MPRELRWKMFLWSRDLCFQRVRCAELHYTRLSPFTALRVCNRVTDHKKRSAFRAAHLSKFPRPPDCWNEDQI